MGRTAPSTEYLQVKTTVTWYQKGGDCMNKSLMLAKTPVMWEHMDILDSLPLVDLGIFLQLTNWT